MLNSMARFMSGDSCRGYAILAINLRTQINSFINGIIVVSQKTCYRNYFYIVYSIFPKHFFRNFLSCKPRRKRNLAKSSKPALEDHRYYHAYSYKKQRNKEN